MVNFQDDEDDRHCAWIHEAGHEKEGQRCEAWHVAGSRYCFPHSGNQAKLHAVKAAKVERRKELVERLALEQHDLRTPEQVQSFYELLINCVCADDGVGEKAKLLALMLPTVYRISKELAGDRKGSGSFEMELSKDGTKLKAQFSTPQELDEFLKANEEYTIAIMEKMHQKGQIKAVKPVKTITVDARDVDLDSQRIDSKALARISDKTAIPLKESQVKSLFGRNLRTERMPAARGIKFDGDVTGFDGLWEADGSGMPDDAKPILHDWEQVFAPTTLAPNIMVEKWKCRRCGIVEKRKNNSVCIDPVKRL